MFHYMYLNYMALNYMALNYIASIHLFPVMKKKVLLIY